MKKILTKILGKKILVKKKIKMLEKDIKVLLQKKKKNTSTLSGT